MSVIPTNLGASHSLGGADVANAALWAEFERRRRADRLNRRKRVSEVQQILLEVQKERHSSTEGSVCHTPHSLSHSLSASASALPSPGRLLASSASTPPKRPSEVQLILAEVQQERLAAAGSALAQVPTASSVAVAPTPVHPAQTAASPQRRRLNFEASTIEGAGVAAATSPPRLATIKARLPRSPSPGRSTPSTARRSRSTPQLSVPRVRPESPATKRLSQAGSVGRGTPFETDEARNWAANLRRPPNRSSSPNGDRSGASNYCLGPQGPPEAYPAGGWDDRTACPRNFNGFDARLPPAPKMRPTLRLYGASSRISPGVQQVSSRGLLSGQQAAGASSSSRHGSASPAPSSGVCAAGGGSRARTASNRKTQIASDGAASENKARASLLLAEERLLEAGRRLEQLPDVGPGGSSGVEEAGIRVGVDSSATAVADNAAGETNAGLDVEAESRADELSNDATKPQPSLAVRSTTSEAATVESNAVREPIGPR